MVDTEFFNYDYFMADFSYGQEVATTTGRLGGFNISQKVYRSGKGKRK